MGRGNEEKRAAMSLASCVSRLSSCGVRMLPAYQFGIERFKLLRPLSSTALHTHGLYCVTGGIRRNLHSTLTSANSPSIHARSFVMFSAPVPVAVPVLLP